MAGLKSLSKTVCLCMMLIACKAAFAIPLWEIEGTDNRILLLGSIHFLRAGDSPLPRAIYDAYRKADIIVMELAMDSIDPAEIRHVHQELAIDPHGRNLSEIIGAGSYHKARSLALAIDIDLDLMLPYEPWFAALQITQLQLLKLGFDGNFGIEKTIARMAHEDRKPLLGLEALDEQLHAIDTLPDKAQKFFLLQTLEDAQSANDDLDTIVKAWKQGNLRELDQLLLEGMHGQPEVYDQLLVQRNRRWSGAIIDMMNDSQDYLIIVGALHLIGEDSVQNILKEQGIRTQRLH